LRQKVAFMLITGAKARQVRKRIRHFIESFCCILHSIYGLA